ncbi:MAG: RNA polymerase sigma-70 factor [Candidatus Pseudobacter hemicellulosilyticus]|uniref:RNA polymerase sigma-70 factor n=1 Tax=Candidatus Pseudobacter hemicellulosilyticus TaxID=3121375 RepID=A0AAJ6BDH5_9BACT|nr:MAG: RNA polymerase sigma-70 factor [Pseudobacter sp.]
MLQQIAAGDQAAFALLFDQHHARTHQIAYAITRSEAAAEELVQDIFLKLWLRRAELQQVQDFDAYLFIVTRNESLTALKRMLRRREQLRSLLLSGETLDNSADGRILEKDFERFLEAAIRKLPAQQQQVYRLSREKGLSRDEIADLLSLSPNTVKTHLSQALKSVRAYCVANIDSPAMLVILLSVTAERGAC